MIPKIIHYCWFGDERKPKLVKECILSWQKFLPDYKIIEWNEDNSDLSHPFVKEAYLKKKWAFVSDYVRLDILSKYGGIYLDTDMLLLKSLDDLLINECFFGAEDDDFISCGIIGCIQGFEFIEKSKHLYDEIKDFANLKNLTIPKLITKNFRDAFNYNDNFKEIVLKENIKIYPRKYFYSLPLTNKNDVNNYQTYIAEESFAIHLWLSSWVENSEFQDLRNSEYMIGWKKVFYKLKVEKKIDYKYLRKLLSAVKQSFNRKR